MPPSKKSAERAAIDLTSITGNELAEVSTKPDAITHIEEVSADRDQKAEEVNDLKQNRDERKKYAHRIFVLICCWIGGLLLILLLQGLGQWYWLKFSLSQPVLLSVIGSTTVNVLGIFYIVAHYLFPSNSNFKDLRRTPKPR